MVGGPRWRSAFPEGPDLRFMKVGLGPCWGQQASLHWPPPVVSSAPLRHDSVCLPRPQDEVAVETTNPQQNKMDKLIEILNSMRNNSSDVDAKLTTFMEEAQNSTNSEEMLGEIVRTIYQKAVSDRSFAFTAAKLCDKMALFMVEGTKFRSLLLNMLQVTGHQQLSLPSPAPPRPPVGYY